MIDRRSLTIAAVLLPAGAAFAQAQTRMPAKQDFTSAAFTPAAFEAAQAAGRPILIDVYAPWCSTCRAQSAVLATLLARPELSAITVLKIDYDSQKDAMRRFGVTQRSTLIAFSGRTEKSRLVGDTSPTAIETLVRSAI